MGFVREVFNQDDDDGDVVRARLVLKPELVRFHHERDRALLRIARRHRGFDHARGRNEFENPIGSDDDRLRVFVQAHALDFRRRDDADALGDGVAYGARKRRARIHPILRPQSRRIAIVVLLRPPTLHGGILEPLELIERHHARARLFHPLALIRAKRRLIRTQIHRLHHNLPLIVRLLYPHRRPRVPHVHHVHIPPLHVRDDPRRPAQRIVHLAPSQRRVRRSKRLLVPFHVPKRSQRHLHRHSRRREPRALRSKLSVSIEHAEDALVVAFAKSRLAHVRVLVRLVQRLWVVPSLRAHRVAHRVRLRASSLVRERHSHRSSAGDAGETGVVLILRQRSAAQPDLVPHGRVVAIRRRRRARDARARSTRARDDGDAGDASARVASGGARGVVRGGGRASHRREARSAANGAATRRAGRARGTERETLRDAIRGMDAREASRGGGNERR